MKRIGVLIPVLLMSLVIVPYVFGVSPVPPTFDLGTSSNLASATDAVYSFHIENRDSSTSIALSMVIPAGYSVNSMYFTNKSRTAVMTGQGWGMTFYAGLFVGMLFTIIVTTTSTPGHYRGIVSSAIGALGSDIVLTEPTPTAPGKLDVPGVSLKGKMWLDLSTVPGFFINPSTPGDYTWGPTFANSTSGQRVASVPRPGFTQKVTIIGTSVTTQPTTSATRSASSRATSVASEASTTLQRQTTTMSQTQPTTIQTVTAGYDTLTGLLTPASVIGAVVVIVMAVAAALLVRTKRTAKREVKLEDSHA
jgi:hypothetical protein